MLSQTPAWSRRQNGLGYAAKKIMARIACVEGQVRAVSRLVEEDADHEQIAMQTTAARRALDQAFYELLTDRLVDEAERGPSANTVRASVGELVHLLTKLA